MTLDEILEAVRKLSIDEQRHLRIQLDQQLAQQDEAAKMHSFHQALIKSGLVTTIKPPPAPEMGERRLIKVRGEPLSETIIAERR